MRPRIRWALPATLAMLLPAADDLDPRSPAAFDPVRLTRI
jgi:hypothetical protein